MPKKIELRKIRDFGEIINDTFVFISQNWKQLLKTYVVICGAFILASLVVSILNQIKMTSIANEGSLYRVSSSSPFRMFGWEYLLAALFAYLSYSSIHLTTLAYIAVYREKGNVAPTVDEVWAYFKFYFFRTTFSAILLGICIGLAFVMCLIPGFYVWPALSLVIPIMVFENTTLGYGFSRGFQLVKDNYWTTLGVLVVSVIILYVAMMVFILPLTVINLSSVLVGGHKLSTTYSVLTAIAQHICQMFYMMPTVAIALCYFSLTELKDNTGLLDRINSLGSTEPPVNDLPTEEY